MTKQKKLRMTSFKDKGMTGREKAEIVFMVFFLALLAASVLAFIIAGLEVVGGYAK